MLKISFIFTIVRAGVAISSDPDEFMNGANLGFTTQSQQGSVSAPVPGDLAATFQGPSDLSGGFAVNPSNLQGSNLSPNDQFGPFPSQVNGNDNTALLFDESTGGGGGTDSSIPSVPIQILDGVPELIDPVSRWLNNPKEPECKKNKHSYCCQRGAPKLRNGRVTAGRSPVVEPKVLADPVEYSQRRRLCRNWSADDPACQWPENIFCCYCKDANRVAYFCYNQPYTDLPQFQNVPVPEPRQISGPQQDPNPEDPNPVDLPGQKKRAIIDRSLDNAQSASISNTVDPLYAENISSESENRGRKRKPDTCTDKFLESVGVSPYRYKYPSRPKVPKSEDGSEGSSDKLDEPIP